MSRRCGSSKLSKGGIVLKLFVFIGEAGEGVYLSTYLRGQLPRIGLGIDLCRGRWWATGVCSSSSRQAVLGQEQEEEILGGKVFTAAVDSDSEGGVHLASIWWYLSRVGACNPTLHPPQPNRKWIWETNSRKIHPRATRNKVPRKTTGKKQNLERGRNYNPM